MEWAAELAAPERRRLMKEIIVQADNYTVTPETTYLSFPPVGLTADQEARLASLAIIEEDMESIDVPTLDVAPGEPIEHAVWRADVRRRIVSAVCEQCGSPATTLAVVGGVEHWRCLEHSRIVVDEGTDG